MRTYKYSQHFNSKKRCKNTGEKLILISRVLGLGLESHVLGLGLVTQVLGPWPWDLGPWSLP